MLTCPPDHLARYQRLIRSLLPEAIDIPAQPPSAVPGVRVEWGTVLPMAVTRVCAALLADRATEFCQISAALPAREPVSVIDRIGHPRPPYLGLLAYSGFLTDRWIRPMPPAAAAAWEQAMRGWWGRLRAAWAAFPLPDGPIPADRGAEAVTTVWSALALHIGTSRYGNRDWVTRAADTFARLVCARRPGGAFLSAGASDNPETFWYHELTLLHAAACYAAHAGDEAVAAAVMRNTEYHLNETQPDHASSHPWGLLAFICNPATHPLADALLHSVRVHYPGGAQGVSLMLLADTLYCLGLLPLD